MSKHLIFILLLLFANSLFADTEGNYPIKLEKKFSLSGRAYKLNQNNFVVVNNNWLDKTTTISILDSELEKKSLILNNTEIRDLFVDDSLIVSVAISNRRAFLTTFNSDFTVNKIFLLDTNISVTDNLQVHESHNGKYIISKNSELFYFDTKKKVKQILSNSFFQKTFCEVDSLRFFYVRQSDNVSYLIENINHKYEKELLRIEPANDYNISIINSNIIVECHYESNSHIFIYSNTLKLINEFWVDVPKEQFTLMKLNSKKIGVYVLSYNDDKYTIRKLDSKLNITSQYNFPNYIISPLCIRATNDEVNVIFQNAIYSFDKNININFYKPVSIPSLSNNNTLTSFDNKDYFVFSSVNTFVYTKSDNPFWQVYSYYDKTINYIIPIALIIVIFIIYYLYLKKKDLNKTLLELSDNDFIFVFNKKGDLININKRAMKIIEIDSSVPLGRFFKYYCVSEHTKELYEIFEKTRTLKENFQQKIHIYSKNELSEYICNSVTKRRTTGSIVGYLISGTDVTEELRQQKMNNFAQLAHDMQTNLSTLKLNAEELNSDNESSSNKKQKIIKQINILNQKVRDIVTVGRSASVHKAKHNAKDILSNVISEFDTEFYPNISFKDESDNFELYVDKQKLSRAIRNATENSLKSMKDKADGILTLRAYKNSKYAYFIVQDNGKGMSKNIKENMLKPFFTSAGGTGLGTMIMKNAIEQHGGEIIVESEEGKGTTISFKIPLS